MRRRTSNKKVINIKKWQKRPGKLTFSMPNKSAFVFLVPATLSALYIFLFSAAVFAGADYKSVIKGMFYEAMPASLGASNFSKENGMGGLSFIFSKDKIEPLSLLSSGVFLISNLEDELRLLESMPEKENEPGAKENEPKGEITPPPATTAPNGENDDPGGEKEPEVYPISDITISPSGKDTGYLNIGNVYLNNRTEFSLTSDDLEKLLNQKGHFKFNPYNTTVLIIHTHGTESYTEEGAETYLSSDENRTQNDDENVIAVGEVLKETLVAAGIKTVHITKIHDYPTYSKSYPNMLETLESELKEWPNVKIVIDLHRDALLTESGVKYKTVTTVEGKKAAQVMLVVGTSASGLSHKNWKTNLSFALKLQKEMSSSYKDIARPIDLVENRYNQHMTGGSLILEVGTSGNTLEEAKLSAKYAGASLAKIIKSYK